MPSYKLHYFNIRARAEVARYIFALSDTKYEDIRHTGEDWQKFKKTTPFGQMPVLEVDGEMLCQSHAINRLLASRTGLMGKTDLDGAKIDMLCGCMEDFLKPLLKLFSAKDDEKEEMKKKCAEDFPEKLKSLESCISGDYFLGDKMSLADLQVTLGLEWPAVMGVPLSLDNFPKLKAVTEKVNKNPKIAAWIAKRPESTM